MSIQIETDILVIGAGLTGLTTAFYLNKAGKNFMVAEVKPVAGGVIQTIEQDGFIFEKGPNTGVLGNDLAVELFDDLGEACQLEIAGKSVNKRYILKDGRWEALPSGVLGGIVTPLFTFADKLRLLGEPFRKPGTNPNETLAELVRRRMGKSFLDYAVDPFILGVYAGDPTYIVPKYALPKLYNLEQKYGSFIGGSVKQAREKKKLGIVSRATREIFSVKGGLSNLTKALYQSAGESKFLLGISDLSVQPVHGGFVVVGVDADKNEMIVKAKKVISTVGAHRLKTMMNFLPEEFYKPIVNLQYAKVVQVSLGFKQWDGMKLDGFGGLIPHKENRQVLGVLFPSAFFPDRAPEGGAMLSVFMGGVRRPDIYDMPDEEIRRIVDKEIKSLMGLKEFNPDIFHISRYKHAIPQYGADCAERFDAVEKAQEKYPGLIIAGNLRNGIGMADRIQQGRQLADAV
ncbi:MAG: protoporphyrinogen oxidase [Bacteroidota bacterium]|nr:protoporphyrinogen oxidase [Bacteroidota bacterium]